MAHVDWRISGPELTSCNCDWGCPCQFNALPTHGHCSATVGMRIDRGHFGGTKLDGLCWAGVFRWPGPIHKGHGEVLAIVDERATPAQREAILKILTGQETEPGATIFNVFATMYEKVHDPVFKPIVFEADMEKRRGRISVAGLVDLMAEPIRNPVTGEEHRARVTLPRGFEYHDAEYASGTARTAGPIALNWDKAHAHFAILDIGPTGPKH